jgi:GTPase SAR1 family protein
MFPTSPIKVMMVGNGGVGRAAFIRRHLTGEFENKHTGKSGNPDLLYLVTCFYGCIFISVAFDLFGCPLKFYTNYGIVRFEFFKVNEQQIDAQMQ